MTVLNHRACEWRHLTIEVASTVDLTEPHSVSKDGGPKGEAADATRNAITLQSSSRARKMVFAGAAGSITQLRCAPATGTLALQLKRHCTVLLQLFWVEVDKVILPE